MIRSLPKAAARLAGELPSSTPPTRRWYPVRGALDTARFTEFSYQRRDLLDGAGYFEGVGLVRVGDRVAVAITVNYGQDSQWDTDPDAGVAGPHPLAELLPIAAKRLGS
jgi:hypothetical protein